MNLNRFLPALGAVVVSAGLISGCGGVPGNAVAEVDGTPIEKRSFDHWINVAAKSGGQPGAAVPQPPEYAACVTNKRKTAPKPAKGQPKVTDAALKKQCQQEYEALRTQVLGLLVNEQWIEGEAEQLGIKVTDAEVKKSFETQKKQSFPKAADYTKFLKDSGQTEADILTRVRLDALATKIRERVIKGKDKVSAAQIKTYYDKNKAQFAQPEQRDVRIVLTKGREKAEQAKAAIDSGDSFASVAKRFSTDQASKNQGGKLAGGVQKGQQEKALDEAIFAADRREVEGPVKTQFGYYVFEVTKTTPASQQSLAQATPTIKQALAAQNQQKALQDFVTRFQREWREKTDCREGYVTENCKNGPKPTPTPNPAQQQQPGQAAPVPTTPEGR